MQKEKDPMGAAIADYHKTGGKTKSKLKVFSPMFDDDEIPLFTLFRKFEEMPLLEKEALKRSEGKILDVGAGSGCHSLVLQEMGKEVTAIDISPYSIETMKERGVKNAELVDFWDIKEQYDTVLMLMNGIGIVGTLNELPDFFKHINDILTPNGKVIVDSSDLCYLFEDEDGIIELPDDEVYYGELIYQMQYKNIKGEEFPWLYIDADTLQKEALSYGFKVEIIKRGEHYDYLAEIRRK